MDIVGIDLGTTNSAIGIVESGFPILLADSDGARITPSAVGYSNNGNILVGQLALRQKGAFNNVITSVKRYMGGRYSDYAQSDNCVALSAGSNGGILVAGKKPQEISAEILKKLKEIAEMQLDRPISKAVITVPAYFNDNQRNATKEAGEIAGLEVVRILSEPTAAALAYGLDKLDEKARIAVYDLGGGTFDISILEMRDGIFQVLATDGDTQLGGDQIDEAVAHWFWNQVGDSSTLTLSERQILIDTAKKAKEILSQEQSATLRIPFFREDKNLEAQITREIFDKLIATLIGKTESHCRRVLNDVGITDPSKQLDTVLLVGGSTRIPCVKNLVERVFQQVPDTSQHPDEVVALGAVVQAGILSGAIGEMVLLDVTPLSLGIETYGGLMNVLIPRNTTIPCKAGEMFTNAVAEQRNMSVRVLQGEREMARDNWELGKVDVQFTPAAKGQARVGVQFSIDENGILEVLARDTKSNKDTLLEINSAAVDVDDTVVGKMVSESVDYAFDDMSERIFTEAKMKAEELLPAVELAMNQVGEMMDSNDLAMIRTAESDVRIALDGNAANELKAAVQRLDKATEHMAAILVERAMEDALSKKIDND